MPDYQLHLGDCLDFMRGLAAGSVDAVVTDPPYGTGTAEWDNDPDPDAWSELQRLCPNGPIAVMGYAKQLFRWSRHFGLELIAKIVWHKYNEVLVSPGLTRAHQDIAIWGISQKQIHAERVREPYSKLHHLAEWHGGRPMGNGLNDRLRASQRKNNGLERNPDGRRCSDIWAIAAPGAGFNAHLRQHPNQKPLDLMTRLTLLLTDESNTMIDPFMGSGTTGVAALKLGRRFIGCEIDPTYYAIAEKRIREAAQQPLLFAV